MVTIKEMHHLMRSCGPQQMLLRLKQTFLAVRCTVDSLNTIIKGGKLDNA